MLLEIVRCPYCVQGDCFRPMFERSQGTFACLGCGHTSIPDDPHSKCPCVRCHEMNQVANRCRDFADFRRYPVDGVAIDR